MSHLQFPARCKDLADAAESGLRVSRKALPEIKREQDDLRQVKQTGLRNRRDDGYP